jgi:hypothetical protein
MWHLKSEQEAWRGIQNSRLLRAGTREEAIALCSVEEMEQNWKDGTLGYPSDLGRGLDA